MPQYSPVAKTRSQAQKASSAAFALLREFEWWIILLVGAGAFSLAMWGFLDVGWPQPDGSSTDMSPSDALYRTLQLFVFEGGHLGGVSAPLQLEIARLALPAVGGYLAIKFLLTLFAEEASLMGLKVFSPSVVICGLGEGGFQIAQSLRDRGVRLAVIEKNPNNEQLTACRRLGAVVLVSDATDPLVLRRSGVESASFVISVCGDDRTNAEVALRVRDVALRRTTGSTTCIVHIDDPQLATLLKSYELGEWHQAQFRLDCFNIHDSGARALLREFPSFSERPNANEHPHLLVVGFGKLSQSLVVQASRRWVGVRERSDSRLLATVIESNARSRVAALQDRFPNLSSACELRALDLDIESAEFDRGEFLMPGDDSHDITRVYVCLGDDSLGMTAALKLHRLLPEDKVPIVVRMRRAAGMAKLLEHQGTLTARVESIRGFGLVEQTYDPDLLLGGTYEILARATHEEHVQFQLQQGETIADNPSLVPWDDLPDTLKESNRDQANHIAVKLDRIHSAVVPWSDWEAASFQFSQEEIELLAKMEHARWTEERQRNGWTYAPTTKDASTKTSPHLVPWDQLSAEIRELDRIAVRGMPGFLARAGFQIVRLGETATLERS